MNNILIDKTISISNEEFQLIRELIYKNFGINLTEHKKPLLHNRLQWVLKKNGINSFTEYYRFILNDKNGDRFNELIDAVSTNHTFFFREKNHFDFLIHKVLPDLTAKLAQSQDPYIRIWCAASSTGEEPYGLAMVLKDYFGDNYSSWIQDILATDISNQVLSDAIRGIYTERKMQQVPEIYKTHYFNKVDEEKYQLSNLIKREVTFRRFNLMSSTFPFNKSFHIIFCCNVMIYFDQKIRENLIYQLAKVLLPGGYLFLGNAESLGRISTSFEYIAPSIYQKIV
ncbi:MAG: chemotaxis protein CheR [Deltaproteobacteria bacterium]|nr:chemotaxis protein CheR [Deltaproteobacteria bacterium]